MQIQKRKGRLMADFSSPFYPYSKVNSGASTYLGIEKIPKQIVTYLLDMPDSAGYIPMDDNNRPRVRMIKYLWHDCADPLKQALPTPQEKLSMVFDPDHPVTGDFNAEQHPKGYRIYPQEYWGQSQTVAQTTLKVYMARTRPASPYRAELGVYFEIFSNVNFEANTKSAAYSRCYAIEQAIIESLHGVNITGVGTFNFSTPASADNGSRPIVDSGTNVGRLLHMSLSWMGGENEYGNVETGFCNN